VFTVRGIRHFGPRFRHVGVDIALIETAAQFEEARKRWDEVEYRLLVDKIQSRSRPGRMADEYNALNAVLNNDADAFEAHIKALEHRKRAGLTVVATRNLQKS
jgi:hypothetical protein